jgi:CheY-like chemotaxis protein
MFQQPLPPHKSAIPPSGSQASLRILVVDDSPDTAASLALLLELKGHAVRTAADGPEAVQAAEEFLPHAVLLDLSLPTMNGFEAARRIRQEAWGTSMLLIAATGWGEDQDRARSSESGFDHHLVKPIDPVSLLRLLATADPATRAAARRTPGKPSLTP